MITEKIKMVVAFTYPFGGSINVTDDTCDLVPHTFPRNGQIWEWDQIKIMGEYVKLFDDQSPHIFIDVGAQAGLYTLCAKYFPHVEFHAFEPFKPNFHLLQKNINLNALSNVVLYDVALSNEDSTSTLQICKSHNGLHTMGKVPQRFSDVSSIEVTTRTLDNLFSGDKKISYIKIDTEGWEYFILNGAVQVLKKWKPILQLEVCDTNLAQCGLQRSTLFSFLDKLGYRLDRYLGEEHFFVSE